MILINNDYKMDKQINIALDEFETNIHSKINRMKYTVWLDVHGPPGAEKVVTVDPAIIDKKIKKLLDKFEEDVKMELQKLNNYQKIENNTS